MNTPISFTTPAPTKLEKMCFQVLSRFFICNLGFLFIKPFMVPQVYVSALKPSNLEWSLIFETCLQMLGFLLI